MAVKDFLIAIAEIEQLKLQNVSSFYLFFTSSLLLNFAVYLQQELLSDSQSYQGQLS